VWLEEFYCVGRRGPQGRLLTLALCPDGSVGDTATAHACPLG